MSIQFFKTFKMLRKDLIVHLIHCMLVQSTSHQLEETLCPLNSVHVALSCLLGSKVCGVENLPPLHGRSVMAGVDFYRVFPSWKWRYTREPIWFASSRPP